MCKKIFYVLMIIVTSISTPAALFAQTAVATMDKSAQEAQWKQELADTEAEIANWQTILNNTKQGTASLQKDAKVLNAKIQQAKAFIKQKQIAIAKLRSDISVKDKTIKTLEQKIADSHDSMAQIIRKTNQMDVYSLPEVILSKQTLSDFFSDADSYSSINKSLGDLLNQVRTVKNLTQKEKDALDKQKNKETDIAVSAEADKKQVEKNEAEKKYLIEVNKTQEKSYEQVITDRKKKAAQIRAALFSLRDSASIPFGTALTYAQVVSDKTGIRPAFLLAILTQESSLGKNVGTCNRPGDPPEKSWKNVMPGPNEKANSISSRDDQSAFVRITTALGVDPETQRVSCPLGGKGWGGAMGPAQFIPTTWEGYAPRISKALGVSAADPWNPEHAFMASGLYLTDLGATASSFTAERKAALKYYAGGNWNKPANAFYGNQVMSKATSIQETMIDPLNL